MPRVILVHLNVQAANDDSRTTDEIVQAVQGAIEVGSDEDGLLGLDISVVLAEEII